MSLATRLLRGAAFLLGDLFGMRFHPIDKVLKMHNGIDIKTYGKNLPIYSLEHGVVDGVGYDKSAGNYVRIMYRRIGIILYLFHLLSYNVKKGDYVSSSRIVGYVGTTGASTGVHLHIGVKRIGSTKFIDPMSINYISPEDERLEEDGILGPKTMYKLQLIYNQFPDCIISGQRNIDLLLKFPSIFKKGLKGSPWVKTIQKDLGCTADGLWGPETTEYIQRATNTPVTRKLLKANDPSIKEIQRRINNKERLWG